MGRWRLQNSLTFATGETALLGKGETKGYVVVECQKGSWIRDEVEKGGEEGNRRTIPRGRITKVLRA